MKHLPWSLESRKCLYRVTFVLICISILLLHNKLLQTSQRKTTSTCYLRIPVGHTSGHSITLFVGLTELKSRDWLVCVLIWILGFSCKVIQVVAEFSSLWL